MIFFLVLKIKIKTSDNFNEINPMSKLELFDFTNTSLDSTKQGNSHSAV